MKETPKYTRHTYSYIALRKTVGWIGILLPFVLWFGATVVFNENPQSTISHYYYTHMRNLFVGSLCAVGLFLFFYAGYDKWDDWAGNLAAVFAIGVAWMPTSEYGVETIGVLHFVCATLFFLILSAISIFLFTKTHKGKAIEAPKKNRNLVYKLCGYVMIICLLAIIIYVLFFQEQKVTSLIYWAEAIALVAFGISWLTKGGSIFPDGGALFKF
jgi:small-conductance mechanosensitive channel